MNPELIQHGKNAFQNTHVFQEIARSKNESNCFMFLFRTQHFWGLSKQEVFFSKLFLLNTCFIMLFTNMLKLKAMIPKLLRVFGMDPQLLRAFGMDPKLLKIFHMDLHLLSIFQEALTHESKCKHAFQIMVILRKSPGQNLIKILSASSKKLTLWVFG